VTLSNDEVREGRLQVSSLSFPPGRHAGVVAEFDHLKGYGHIVDDETGLSMFVHYAEVLGPRGARVTLVGGERVTFDVVPGDKGPMAGHVKRLDPRSPLGRFVRIPAQAWQILAALAEQQDVWVLNHPDDEDEPAEDAGVNENSIAGSGSSADLPVLRSYIEHTFSRLIDEGKIAYGAAADGRRAAFNTGLVTPNQEEIYGVLSEKPDDDGYPWRLLGWMKESDGRVAGVFSPRPARARYWDDPSVLFYHSRLPLILDWDHFVKDNLSRYPEDLQDEAMALMLTRSAIDRAVERVGRNYKAAVPQFHRGEVQLLLPLALRGTAEAQLALVVRRVGDEYHGETVLPLAAALKNARLLARPDRDWLNP
jgi:cold shock CspA family protein